MKKKPVPDDDLAKEAIAVSLRTDDFEQLDGCEMSHTFIENLISKAKNGVLKSDISRSIVWFVINIKKAGAKPSMLSKKKVAMSSSIKKWAQAERVTWDVPEAAELKASHTVIIGDYCYAKDSNRALFAINKSVRKFVMGGVPCMRFDTGGKPAKLQKLIKHEDE